MQYMQARAENVSMLRGIPLGAWTRTGTQEGVDEVSLCDVPGFMSQHDAAHMDEIAAWKRARSA